MSIVIEKFITIENFVFEFMSAEHSKNEFMRSELSIANVNLGECMGAELCKSWALRMWIYERWALWM